MDKAFYIIIIIFFINFNAFSEDTKKAECIITNKAECIMPDDEGFCMVFKIHHEGRSYLISWTGDIMYHNPVLTFPTESTKKQGE